MKKRSEVDQPTQVGLLPVGDYTVLLLYRYHHAGHQRRSAPRFLLLPY